MNKLQNSEPSAKIPSSPLNMSNVLINKILQEFSGQNGTNTGHSLSPPDDNLYRVLSELCGRKNQEYLVICMLCYCCLMRPKEDASARIKIKGVAVALDPTPSDEVHELLRYKIRQI